MNISGFELVLFIILGIIVGGIAVITFMKMRNSKSSEETRDILENCLEDLIDILNTVISMLDRSKYKDELEYQEELTKLVADKFKKFLKENNILPSYIINSISDELLYTLIDKASELLEKRLRDKEIDSVTEIVEEESKTEIGGPETNKTDISGTINNFYD